MPQSTNRESILRRARRIELKSRRWVARALAGSTRSVFRGTGVEFDSVREYSYGDDVRALDWNVTARVGRPYVKQFVTTRERDIVVLLDRSSSLEFGSADRTKADVAAELLTVVAFIAERGRERIGLIEFGALDGARIEPARGHEVAKRLVTQALLPARADAAVDWSALGAAVTGAVKQSALLFVISDFQDVPDPREFGRLAFRHEMVAVRVHDPRELALEGTAPVACFDRERGTSFWLDPSSARERSAFAQAAARHRLATQRVFEGAGVEWFDLSTRDEHFESLFRFLELRSRRIG